MGKLCLKEVQQREKAGPDKPSPTGVAKRSRAFEKAKSKAELIPMLPTPRINLDRACAQGTPELSAGERCLMAFYLSHLSTKDQAAGKSAVWPGAWNAATALGIAQSTIRRQKAGLEEKGLIIRKYDHRNRPVEGGAIDLKPFIVSASQRLKDIDRRLGERRAELAAKREAEESSKVAECTVDFREPNIAETQPETSDSKIITPVIADDHLNGESNNSESEADILEKGLEEKISAKFITNVLNFTAGTKLVSEAKLIEECLKISPELRRALVPDNRPLPPEDAAKRLYEALPELFPGADQTSISHTLRWAVKRYGIRVFECLTVALEDPKIADPERYFGWLATTSDDINLKFALERVRRKNPPPIEIDFPKNPLGQSVAKAIVQLTGVAKFNNWFAAEKTRFCQEADMLIIETTSSLAEERMNNHFSSEIGAAVQAAGFTKYRVKHVKSLTAVAVGNPGCEHGSGVSREAAAAYTGTIGPCNHLDTGAQGEG